MKLPLRKLLVLAVVLTALSQFSGINAVIFYGPTVLKSAGIVTSDALFYQVILGSANMLFTFIAIWKVDTWGRRPLYITGSICAAIALALTGICFLLNVNGWGLVSLHHVISFILCILFRSFKICNSHRNISDPYKGHGSFTMHYVHVGERLDRELLFPVLRDGLGIAPTFFIFSFFCVLSFFYAKRNLFETKGKKLEEIRVQ